MPLKRLFAAIVVSGVVILSGPYMVDMRDRVASAFPGRLSVVVTAMILAAVAIAVVLAAARIRDRRALRYGALAAAVTVGVAYATALRTGDPTVDAVERFHFVEYGLITWLFCRACRPLEDGSIFLLPALAGLLVGTLDEWFQWFIPVRIGELHDVFLNGAAIACGLLFSVGLDPPRVVSLTFRRGSLTRVGAFGATVAFVFALFFDVVHLGYEVSDDQIGSFRSRYTKDALGSLSGDRAARWRERPPLAFGRISREDQYLSEAIWHVQRRNSRWSEGDAFAASRENRLLEKYYGPALDAPSFSSRSGHRWPPAQRGDAERRTASDHHPYVSDAHPLPIYTWPKLLFWTITLVVISGLGLVALYGARGEGLEPTNHN